MVVNTQNRIPKVVEGAVDLVCGQTTNNTERQKLIAFSPIIFVSGIKLLVKQASKLKSYRDLKGRRVGVTLASTNEAAIKSLNAKEGLNITVVEFQTFFPTIRTESCIGSPIRSSTRW